MPKTAAVKPPALQPRSRKTERNILEAALRILGEIGAEGLTTDRVSQAAGVSVGTIYRRFGNKEQLLRSTQFEFLRIFTENLDHRFAALTDQDAADPARTILHMTRSMAENFRDHADPLRQLLIVGMQNPVIFQDGRQASVEGGRKYTAQILRHREAIAHEDPEAAVDFTYRLVYAACSHRLTQGQNLESARMTPWAEMITRLADANRAYLLTPPAGLG